MLSPERVNPTTARPTLATQWEMSSTRFSTDWQVTATLLLTDLGNELEYNSTFGPASQKPVTPAFPSFFAMLEAEGKADEVNSFLE